MSSLVFPTGLQGLTFNGNRTPIWKTRVQEALSGKETALGYQQYPKFRFELNFEWLDSAAATNDYRKVAGLYGAMNGRYDTFLYTDPRFNTLVDENFGTGNGALTAFQIIAKDQNSGGPGVAEIIQNFNGAVTIKDNGVTRTGGGVDYTLGATGIVTFTTPPVNAHALTWSGAFYYRCRFLEDEQDFSEFMQNMWETRQLTFRSVIL